MNLFGSMFKTVPLPVVVVTLHDEFVNYLVAENLLPEDNIIVDTTPTKELVRGKRIIVASHKSKSVDIPFDVAAEAAMVTVIRLNLSSDQFERELTESDIRNSVVDVNTYTTSLIHK